MSIIYSFVSILGLFSILNIVTNQADLLLIGLNNINNGKISGKEDIIAVTGKTSDRKNVFAIEFNIKNEGAGKSKKISILL